MKSTIKILATAVFMLSPLCIKAANDTDSTSRKHPVVISAGSDIVSSYDWRGVRVTGAAFQPSLSLEVAGFSATAWGSVDFAGTYREADLTLAYSIGPVSICVTDYYWTGHENDSYFAFGKDSPHRLEVGASWMICKKVPITLSWYTMVLGPADVNIDGKRAYSSYVEIAYPFSVRTVDMIAGVGAVPWNSHATYGTGDRGFCVQNVFIGASKTWEPEYMKGFGIGLFTKLVWNPVMKEANFIGGLSFSL